MKSRLFIKFLLLMLATSLSVVILLVLGMQFFVYRNFTNYVVQQELDSLDGLATALADEYRQSDSWEKFRNNPRQWHELVSLYFPAREPRQPLPPANEPRGELFKDHEQSLLKEDRRPPEFPNSPERQYSSELRDRRPPFMHPRRELELSDLARRLSLYDAGRKLVFGNPQQAKQAFKPIEADGQMIGWLGLKKEPQITSPTDISFLKRQSRAFYMIGAIVLLMSFVVSVIFSRHLISPIRRIAEGASAIRNRRFDKRITVTSNDELGQLAENFNAMAQTLQRFESTRRQWLSDIAHELRTPLAVLRGEIEAIQDGIRKMNPHSMDSLHAEVMVLSKIVDDLSLIAKTESGIIEMNHLPVDPVRVLRPTLWRYKERLEDRRIKVHENLQTAEALEIMGDADKLAQVFGNIFENTLRYTSSPGTLTVSVDAEKDLIRIIIEDTGPGVPEASLSRLFDRLYRTDAARTRETGGSGLGLSICKSIIEAHQGRIYAENSESGGLRIVIELPSKQLMF